MRRAAGRTARRAGRRRCAGRADARSARPPRPAGPCSARQSAIQNVHMQERALAAGQTVVGRVVGVVAAHEAVLGQLPVDRLDGRRPRARRRRAGSRRAGSSGTRRRAPSSRSACDEHPRSSTPCSSTSARISSHTRPPPVDRRVEAEPGRRADHAIERHPRHDLRVGEVLPTAAHLPDAVVGLRPAVLDGRGQRRLEGPRTVGVGDVGHPAPGGGRRAPRRTRRAGTAGARRCRSGPGAIPRSPGASRARAR